MASPHWFFADTTNWGNDLIELDAGESHHARKVMRVGPSDAITVTDGRGTVATCRVVDARSECLRARIIEFSTRDRPKPELAIFQGAGKANKADVVIERLAELGVAEVRVFESERTVARWDPSKRGRLEERWRSIARSVAKQSRNPWTVDTGPIMSWTELMEQIEKEPAPVCLWEDAERPLRSEFPERADRIALIVGPEGGLAPAEAESLVEAGAALVSLGPTILRTENAPVAAASAVLYHYGRLG